MSFGEFYQGLTGIGDAYQKGLDDYTKKAALSKLGVQLQAGDYAAAAGTAFDSGDAGTGIGLLKLGQAAKQQQLEQAASLDFSQKLGQFGLGGVQGGGLSALGGGSPRADTGGSGLPSFADTSGPSGDYQASLFKRESNGNPNAQASTSSAKGLGQFTDQTWAGVMRQHPDLGLTADGRTDPGQMSRATSAFTADNEAILQRSNLPVNDATRYSLHIFGSAGGPRFVAGTLRNPDAPASAYVNADQVAANRPVFFNRDGSAKTAGQVMGDFSRSFGGGGGGATRQAAAPTAAPVAFAGDEAQTQALEQRMGMMPPVAPTRQTASTDSQADLPAEGTEPAAFYVPGSDPVSTGHADPSTAGRLSPALSSSDPSSRAPAIPTLGGSAPAGRTMSMPGSDALAQNATGRLTVASDATVGSVPAGRIVQSPLGERIPFLLAAAAHPNLPDGQRQLAQTLLKSALDESKLSEGQRDYLMARSQGFGGTFLDYKNELRKPLTPTTVSPGQAVIAPGERSPFFTNPAKPERGEGEKITAQIDARRAAAPGLGLEEGSPSWRSYVATGKVGADRDMSAGEKKSVEAADTAALAAQSSIGLLEQAKTLSGKAYAGPLAAARGTLTGTFGSEAGQATQELDNLVTTNALANLKSIFGGNPTEGERKILLDVQGSSSLPHPLRVKVYDRAIAAAELRQQQNEAKANAIRNGTYFRQGGGPAGAQPAPGGDAAAPRALPAPSSANRPGAVSASDRFGQLVGSGLSKADAYARLHAEGY